MDLVQGFDLLKGRRGASTVHRKSYCMLHSSYSAVHPEPAVSYEVCFLRH